jgi:hypothetical protein
VSPDSCGVLITRLLPCDPFLPTATVPVALRRLCHRTELAALTRTALQRAIIRFSAILHSLRVPHQLELQSMIRFGNPEPL